MALVGSWQHGLFGCFDNFGTCIVTYLVPCYTFGKNAEAVGDSCFLCGAAYFVPGLNLFALLSVRGKIRERKGIDGTFVNDCCAIILCHPCALVQEANEIQCPGSQFMARS
ncbi:cell number regulator 10-like [Haliotis rufescens]|uniref:cell number regulator 10-like n=1 Tax=Haliotis rufescens TaxID=6454 RepID=UPI001EAFA877|nr:cell number regulator 10-like [Haliotis rufescens]